MVMLSCGASENSSWMTACGKLTEQDARFSAFGCKPPGKRQQLLQGVPVQAAAAPVEHEQGLLLRSACASRFSSSFGFVNETLR